MKRWIKFDFDDNHLFLYEYSHENFTGDNPLSTIIIHEDSYQVGALFFNDLEEAKTFCDDSKNIVDKILHIDKYSYNIENKEVNMESELLTVKEIGKKLKVSRQTIYSYMSEGMPKRVNKPPRFVLEDVLKWLEKRG